VDQQYRRQADPPDQWQAYQAQRGTAGDELAVGQQLAVTGEQWQQLDRGEWQARAVAALHPEGFRHQAMQQQPAQHRTNGKGHEQPAPVQPLQHERTDQRPQQW